MRRTEGGQSLQTRNCSIQAGHVQITHLECIELHIGVAVGQALDQGLDCLLGAVGVAGHAIANLHDGAPVLGGEVLVRRLG